MMPPKPPRIPSSDILSEAHFQAYSFNKRVFLQRLGLPAFSLGLVSSLPSLPAWAQSAQSSAKAHALAPLLGQRSTLAGAFTTEKLTRFQDATQYNNFYEFSTDKEEVATLAQKLVTQPWTVRIEGLVKKPFTIGLDELLRLSAMEERIYRLRCVEGWSMVIPWVGYSLSFLIKKAAPLGSAKYLQFLSMADPKTMPGLRSNSLDWPYAEGLRLDEALHPLTLLAFGMYGKVLPKQNGAPLRLVIPWKYGFKSAKSIVAIRFTEKQPFTAWNKAAPQEYGFYSNVNPDVAHPRWSQATERRIGDEGGLFAKRRKTLAFNGYQEQVASLYAGMDLRRNF